MKISFTRLLAVLFASLILIDVVVEGAQMAYASAQQEVSIKEAR